MLHTIRRSQHCLGDDTCVFRYYPLYFPVRTTKISCSNEEHYCCYDLSFRQQAQRDGELCSVQSINPSNKWIFQFCIVYRSSCLFLAGHFACGILRMRQGERRKGNYYVVRHVKSSLRRTSVVPRAARCQQDVKKKKSPHHNSEQREEERARAVVYQVYCSREKRRVLLLATTAARRRRPSSWS